jgi:hypothetical protein
MERGATDENAAPIESIMTSIELCGIALFALAFL